MIIKIINWVITLSYCYGALYITFNYGLTFLNLATILAGGLIAMKIMRILDAIEAKRNTRYIDLT